MDSFVELLRQMEQLRAKVPGLSVSQILQSDPFDASSELEGAQVRLQRDHIGPETVLWLYRDRAEDLFTYRDMKARQDAEPPLFIRHITKEIDFDRRYVWNGNVYKGPAEAASAITIYLVDLLKQAEELLVRDHT